MNGKNEKFRRILKVSFISIVFMGGAVLLLTCNKGGGGGGGEVCDDGVDNDGDGNTDCWDPDCGFEGDVELSCSDGVDNDCDGNMDCWDDDCGFEGAVELTCNDGIDNDCDGTADALDSDCEATSCIGNEECSDFVWCNGEEICADGTCADGTPPCSEDQFCDEENHTCTGECPQDIDMDGYCAEEAGGNDCDDWNSNVHPDAVEVECNGLDDDCDGALHPVEDADRDRYPLDSCCNAETFCNCTFEDTIDKPSFTWPCDCDDDSDIAASSHPGADERSQTPSLDVPEARCVDHDLNCDGIIGADEDIDHHMWCLEEGSADYDCDDTNPLIYTGANENCGNGVDDDCDTLVDGSDTADCTCSAGDTHYVYSGPDGTDGVGPCHGCTETCTADGTWGSCVQVVPAPEGGTCDGIDNNCDNHIDNGPCCCTDGDGDGHYATSCTDLDCSPRDDCFDSDGGRTCDIFYRDADSDGYGDSASGTVCACSAPSGYVADETDCDDGNGNIHPGAAEQCNGVDDDCADGIDEPPVCTTPGESCITSPHWAGDPALHTRCRRAHFWAPDAPGFTKHCPFTWFPPQCWADGTGCSRTFHGFICSGTSWWALWGPYITLPVPGTMSFFDAYFLIQNPGGTSTSNWTKVEVACNGGSTVLAEKWINTSDMTPEVPYYVHLWFALGSTTENVEFRVWSNIDGPVVWVGGVYLVENWTSVEFPDYWGLIKHGPTFCASEDSALCDIFRCFDTANCGGCSVRPCPIHLE